MTVTIGRRELLAALGGAVVAWPLAARAQQAERMRLMGVLMASSTIPIVFALAAERDEFLRESTIPPGVLAIADEVIE